METKENKINQTTTHISSTVIQGGETLSHILEMKRTSTLKSLMEKDELSLCWRRL